MNNKQFEIYKDLICNARAGTLEENIKKIIKSEYLISEFLKKMDELGYEVSKQEITEKEIKKSDKKNIQDYIKKAEDEVKIKSKSQKRWKIKHKTAKEFGYTFRAVSNFLIANDKYNFENETRTKCYLCGKNTEKKFCSEKCAITYAKDKGVWSDEHDRVFKFLKKKCNKKSKCIPPQSKSLYALFEDLKTYDLIEYDVKIEGYIKPITYMYIEVVV
jgi:hypothetical protein